MDIEQVKFKIDCYVAKLNNILTNFNKSPNRRYTRTYIYLIKLKEKSEEYHKKASDILVVNELNLSPTELTFYIKGIQQKYGNFLLLIDQKLVHAKDPTISLKMLCYQ